LLLANLSLTLSSELRAMGVANVLLHMVLDSAVSVSRKSVAESVIIFLLGDRECQEIDRLMSSNVIESYCIPIMEHALNGEEFRGMYPHLVYSARLFDVLARSRAYAVTLSGHESVVPLLLRASRHQRQRAQLESNNEGRRLAIEALRSMARFKLWPASAEDLTFVEQTLPSLVSDNHVGVRCSAAGLWAFLDIRRTLLILFVGNRLEVEGHLRRDIWRESVVPFLFPLPGPQEESVGRSMGYG
jgi:hypothetical protein